MHSPAARALLQPRALLHHPRDTLKDLTLAGHVITITYYLDLLQSVHELEKKAEVTLGSKPWPTVPTKPCPRWLI